MKYFKRIAAIGLAQVAIVIGVVLALSGTQMGAQELPAPSQDAPPTEIVLLDAVFDNTSFAGSFTGNGPFTVNGGVLAANDGVGQRRLVLTDTFQTNRGQELVVFLRSDGGQLISLGELQSVSGAQDFLIPGQLDLNTFNEVQIRDVAFDTHFGSAFLSALDEPIDVG